MRRRSLLTAGLAAFLASCSDSSTRDPLAPDVSRSARDVVSASPVKAGLCHRDGSGSYRLIEISDNAVAAHLGHGDALPGAAVPGAPTMMFSSTCEIVSICPCQFTLEALDDLTAQFGDLGTDYDFLTTNVVTQLFSRSDVNDRFANRFVALQAPGPDWPQANVCVTRVHDPEFVILYSEEIPVTPDQALACSADLATLAAALGVTVP